MDTNATLPGAGLIGTILAWLAAAVSGLLSWRIAAAKTEGKEEGRDEALRKDLTQLAGELRASAAEMRASNLAAARREGAQDQVNVAMAKMMEGLVTRLDRHERVHADLNATLKDHGEALILLKTLMQERAKREGSEGSL